MSTLLLSKIVAVKEGVVVERLCGGSDIRF